MEDELGGKIMTEFAALRPKTYSYLMDVGNSDKKAKGTKKCVIKKYLNPISKVKLSKVKYSKYKMINFDNYTDENKTEHNLDWPYMPDHPYRILIVGGSVSAKKKCKLEFNKHLARY